jgi:hypothetical protein
MNYHLINIGNGVGLKFELILFLHICINCYRLFDWLFFSKLVCNILIF